MYSRVCVQHFGPCWEAQMGRPTLQEALFALSSQRCPWISRTNAFSHVKRASTHVGRQEERLSQIPSNMKRIKTPEWEMGQKRRSINGSVH